MIVLRNRLMLLCDCTKARKVPLPAKAHPQAMTQRSMSALTEIRGLARTCSEVPLSPQIDQNSVIGEDLNCLHCCRLNNGPHGRKWHKTDSPIVSQNEHPTDI
jgi:hypothetical protein